jgi:hypothetical protein
MYHNNKIPPPKEKNGSERGDIDYFFLFIIYRPGGQKKLNQRDLEKPKNPKTTHSYTHIYFIP